MLAALPPQLQWKICRYLGQPYLPIAALPPPALWCAQCGECIGIQATLSHIGFICSVHCRICGVVLCMDCWQRNPCGHALERGGVHYSCQCWEDTWCTCGSAPFPVSEY